MSSPLHNRGSLRQADAETSACIIPLVAKREYHLTYSFEIRNPRKESSEHGNNKRDFLSPQKLRRATRTTNPSVFNKSKMISEKDTSQTTSKETKKSRYYLPKDYQPSYKDIHCGRGKSYARLPGNIAFVKTLKANAGVYEAANTRQEKSNVVALIVDSIRASGGRFIKYDSNKNHQQFYEISRIAAHEKTGHALRDLIKNGRNVVSATDLPNRSRAAGAAASSSKRSSQHDDARRPDAPKSPSTDIVPIPVEEAFVCNPRPSFLLFVEEEILQMLPEDAATGDHHQQPAAILPPKPGPVKSEIKLNSFENTVAPSLSPRNSILSVQAALDIVEGMGQCEYHHDPALLEGNSKRDLRGKTTNNNGTLPSSIALATSRLPNVVAHSTVSVGPGSRTSMDSRSINTTSIHEGTHQADYCWDDRADESSVSTFLPPLMQPATTSGGGSFLNTNSPEGLGLLVPRHIFFSELATKTPEGLQDTLLLEGGEAEKIFRV